MRSPVVFGLCVTVLLLSAADHFTTWYSLYQPVPGWDVVEANLIARMLFDTVGLELGLLIDSVASVLVCLWLYGTKLFPEELKIVFLAVVNIATFVAVVNNVHGLVRMGLL